MSLPLVAEVEHADWPTLQRLCATLGLNPKGRSSVVRLRVLDHVRRRVRPELWRPGVQQQAALLTRLGHPDASTRLWESTIQLDAPAPWIGLGQAQLAAGELIEAAKSFERAAQMGDVVAHLHRAEALAAAGDNEGAVRACDRFLEARPRELRGLLLKANFLARGGWINEASTLLRDTFESHPDTTGLWKGLGDLLLRGGRFDAAAEAYREALRASPEDMESWIDRGAALLLSGQTAAAIGSFREVLERDPRQAAALNDLGVAYQREGRSKSAAITLERAAKHMETPQILRNLAFVKGTSGRGIVPQAPRPRSPRGKPKVAMRVVVRKKAPPPKRRVHRPHPRRVTPAKRTSRRPIVSRPKKKRPPVPVRRSKKGSTKRRPIHRGRAKPRRRHGR